MNIEHADSEITFDLAQRLQEFDEPGVSRVAIGTIGGKVLRNEIQFYNPGIDQSPRFGKNRFERSATQRSSNQRDGAVATSVVAPLRYLEIRRPRVVEEFPSAVALLGNEWIRWKVDRSLTCVDPSNQIGDMAEVSIAEYTIGLYQFLFQLLAIPLRQTAGHDHFRLGKLILQCEERIHRLLSCRLNESAGVHYDKVGLIGLFHHDTPGFHQLLQHHLSIDLVLRTTQILYIYSLSVDIDH